MRIVTFISSVVILALAPPGNVSVVSQQDAVVLTPDCFDTLPYGVEHTCDARFLTKTKASLGELYAAILTRIVADSLLITARVSADTRVAVIVAPQLARGCCSRRAEGPDWDTPRIAVHFDATPRNKKEVGYLLMVHGSVVAGEGRGAGAMALALCYLGRYLAAVESLASRDSKRPSP